jgi:hypothetical protein
MCRSSRDEDVGDAVAFDDAHDRLAALHEGDGRDVEDGVGA